MSTKTNRHKEKININEKDISFLNDEGCTGTFRWTKRKTLTLPYLPRFFVSPAETESESQPESSSSSSSIFSSRNDDLSKKVNYKNGWKAYLESRDPSLSLLQKVTKDPSILDALSFPITLLHAIETLNLFSSTIADYDSTCSDNNNTTSPAGPGEEGRSQIINLVINGATKRAEQTILEDTNYFEEILHYFSQKRKEKNPIAATAIYNKKGTATDADGTENKMQIHLWFVGMEIKETDFQLRKDKLQYIYTSPDQIEVKTSKGHPRNPNNSGSDNKEKMTINLDSTSLIVHLVKGTIKDLLHDQSFKRINPNNCWRKSKSKSSTSMPFHETVIITYNAGYGNFFESKNLGLLWSWLPDLYFLSLVEDLPLIFTCANDYADVAGEYQVMSKVIGGFFMQFPRQNPFPLATTFTSENIPANQAHSDPGNRGYSCGNSYWYCVNGRNKELSTQIDVSDLQSRQRMLATCLSKPDIPENKLTYCPPPRQTFAMRNKNKKQNDVKVESKLKSITTRNEVTDDKVVEKLVVEASLKATTTGKLDATQRSLSALAPSVSTAVPAAPVVVATTATATTTTTTTSKTESVSLSSSSSPTSPSITTSNSNDSKTFVEEQNKENEREQASRQVEEDNSAIDELIHLASTLMDVDNIDSSVNVMDTQEFLNTKSSTNREEKECTKENNNANDNSSSNNEENNNYYYKNKNVSSKEKKIKRQEDSVDSFRDKMRKGIYKSSQSSSSPSSSSTSAAPCVSSEARDTDSRKNKYKQEEEVKDVEESYSISNRGNNYLVEIPISVIGCNISMKDVTLDVNTEVIRVGEAIRNSTKLEIPLPYKVDETTAIAKYKKKKNCLEIVVKKLE